MEHSAFPSDETLAAFIDGRLDEETRKRVVAHVADCEDCYGTVMASRAFRYTDEKPVTVTHPRSWKALWVSSGSVAAAAVIALVIFRAPLRDTYDEYSYNRRTRIGTLLDAANHLPFRPSEARLSGQSVYRPAEPTKRGVTEESHSTRLLAATSAAEDETQSAPAVIRLHTAGVSSLLLGKPDDAVKQLDQALQINHPDVPLSAAIHLSADARLLNDAAAAHYTLFKLRASGKDLLISNEAVACAWTLHPDASTAWNRALILQAMQVPKDAIGAWRDYLALDGTSPWADEARKKLDALTSAGPPSSSGIDTTKARELALSGRQEELIAFARSRPQDIRSFCEEEVFQAWARASLANDKVAAREQLTVARAVASAIRQTAQDDLDTVTVAAIEREQFSDRGKTLAEAIVAFADGRMLSRQHRTSEALAKLNSSSSALRSVSCPLWLRIRVYVGTADYYLGAYAQSAAAIRQIHDALGDASDRYPSVVAQTEWIHGLLEATANHPFEAVRSFRLASSRFEMTGERDNAAFVQMLASETLTITGNADAAWVSGIAALKTGYGYSTPRHLALVNAGMGRAALAKGYTASADEYARAALSSDLRSLDPPFVADALMIRGRALEAEGAPARAELCWNAAAEIARKLPDDALRGRMQADVAFARFSSSSGDKEDLDSSIDACRRRGDQFRLARLSFVRGSRRVKAGDISAAVADYDAAIHALSRVDAADVQAVRTWRDGMRESLDEAIQFAINNGRDGDALRWLTLIRSHGSVSHPPNKKTAVVVYWALSDRVCSWVIRPSSVFFHAEPFSRMSLARLAQGAREDQRTAAALYDKLLRPIESQINPAANLVVLADEFFTAVPFAALYDSRRLQYAVQRFDIRLARTMSLLPGKNLSSAWTPLIVADPAFDVTVLPDLPRLEGAMEEARTISKSFARAQVMSGPGATISAIEQAVPQFGVLHIAAHAMSGEGPLAPSAVVLAPESTRAGLLYAAEIRSQTFGNLHLVVLSACRSATDARGDMSDLAEAFLTAGVPNVIGSSSDVADAQSAQFYGTFYRALIATNDPGAAFRRAQLDAIRSNSSAWKNYVMFTGHWPAANSS